MIDVHAEDPAVEEEVLWLGVLLPRLSWQSASNGSWGLKQHSNPFIAPEHDAAWAPSCLPVVQVMCVLQP